MPQIVTAALLAFFLPSCLALPPDAALPACRTAFFTADGDRLAYRSCGAGTSVLILPGGPGLDSSYMLDVAAMVAAAGFHAVLLEPRGTGASRAALSDRSRLTVAGIREC